MARESEAELRRTNFHHGDLKAAALRAALDLVEAGRPLSLRDVAKAAGVNHRALYRHYDDLDALRMAVAAEGFRALASAMEGAMEGAMHGTKGEAGGGGSLMAAYVRFALDRPGLYAVMFEGTGGDFLTHPVLAPAVAEVTALTAAALRRPEDPPGFSDALRDRAVRAWGLAHGLVDLWRRGALRARGRDEAEAYIIAQLTAA